MEEGLSLKPGQPAGWRARWVARRNRVLSNPRFQSWMSRLPFFRTIARGRARQLFDLLAGFTYTQTLLAALESNLLALLAQGPANLATICAHTQLSEDAALRLVRAARALDLAEEVEPGWWMLGEQGAALSSNTGAQAMIRHHVLLYADLADPLALLRDDRETPTALSRFWTYAGSREQRSKDPAAAAAYSDLMASSQHLVVEQVLAAYDFSGATRLLDVGGGHGAFLGAVADRHPALDLGLFDLPHVAKAAPEQAALAPHAARLEIHSGDFFRDSLPENYDLISLVRILHDHDDAPALDLLRNIHKALPQRGQLLIAEPMADTPCAKGMGDAYFGLYLWAMRSGRPRSASEIKDMLRSAGFSSARQIATRQPIATGLIVARA